MDKLKPDTSKDFIVGESKFMNYMIAGICMLIAVISAIAGDRDLGNFIFLLLLFVPAVIFFTKARRNTVNIRVNKQGVYFKGKLITDWKHFVDARLTQDEKIMSIQDNFIILIRYFIPGTKNVHQYKLPLSNTQDKSDEQVIAAINLYYKENRNR